jgi:hypothetical protein
MIINTINKHCSRNTVEKQEGNIGVNLKIQLLLIEKINNYSI